MVPNTETGTFSKLSAQPAAVDSVFIVRDDVTRIFRVTDVEKRTSKTRRYYDDDVRARLFSTFVTRPRAENNRFVQRASY